MEEPAIDVTVDPPGALTFSMAGLRRPATFAVPLLQPYNTPIARLVLRRRIVGNQDGVARF
jgi:hypothetical protein